MKRKQNNLAGSNPSLSLLVKEVNFGAPDLIRLTWPVKLTG